MLSKGAKNTFLRMILNEKVLLVAGLVILVSIGLPLARNLSRRHQINEEIRMLEQEINDSGKKNEALQKMIGYLESDQFVEEQARLKLGLKKQDEGVAVIKGVAPVADRPTRNLSGGQQADPAISSSTRSNIWKWWSYFF